MSISGPFLMENNSSRFDAALKDLFQEGRPTLLSRITGGIPVKKFLNVEFPTVLERRLDMVLLLKDGSILHLEIQSANDRKMIFRMGIYHVLLVQKYGPRVRSMVLYLGNAKSDMRYQLKSNGMDFQYELIDVRTFDAKTLMESGNDADQVLAMLADGGPDRLEEIVQKIASGNYKGYGLTQMALLSGLRKLSGRLKLELRKIGMVIDISKNVILREWQQKAIKEGLKKGIAAGRIKGRQEGRQQGLLEGRQVGRQEGRQEGQVAAGQTLLREQLMEKFGSIPKWADARLKKASITELEGWARKIIKADTLTQVISQKH